MRAAVLHHYHVRLGIEEVRIDEPRAGEVLVRIAASGICGSDVHLSHGKPDLGDCLPIVLGQEGAAKADCGRVVVRMAPDLL